MKNIKISFLCAIIFTTTAYCTENSENQEPKQQTDATSDKQKSKEQTNTTFIQKILDSKHDKKSTKEQTDSDDQENERRFITRKEVENFVAILLVLYTIASIKYDFFPSKEQQRLQAINGKNIGITGMPRSCEYVAIMLIIDYFRRSR